MVLLATLQQPPPHTLMRKWDTLHCMVQVGALFLHCDDLGLPATLGPAQRTPQCLILTLSPHPIQRMVAVSSNPLRELEA
mmetsp:Transcript_89737/g.155388  ORF Transcript_89737/g.155388 Transcript_89737/m.155388 type:complete len:80 (+) Transcript_89737:245-484(+)